MTCRELADALCDLVAGELEPERQKSCHQHLDECPPCVILLETYQVTIRLARGLPPTLMPAEVMTRLQARLQVHLAEPGTQGAGL